MRWFSRRADTPTRGRHAAGAPPEPGTPEVPAPTPAPAPDTWAETSLRPTPLADVSPAGSGVHLGFGDGSALELGVADSRAATFRALAASLAQGVR